MKNILRSAITNSVATALYIVFVVSVMNYTGHQNFEGPEVLIGVGMLMLFVFSAALTASLVFGKPVLLYLEGKKKEAVSLVAYTLFFFFIIMVIVFGALATLWIRS
jgi:hypothetical protein